MLEYKGIKFDNYDKDEYGVWSTMCEECQRKYSISEGVQKGSAGGVCGVQGCSNSDWDGDIEVNYILFNEDEIGIKE